MKYRATSVDKFENFEELEAAYYNSTKLEVRAGILYALLQGKYDATTGKPRAFLLDVIRENAIEAARLQEENEKTPFPSRDTADETANQMIEKKNSLSLRGSALSKLATKCVMPLIGVYVSYRTNHYGGPITEVDDIAEELLKLMCDWTISPQLALRAEPTKTKVGKFLELYRKHREPSDTWLQAVIHTKNFHLLRCEDDTDAKLQNRIGMKLVAYLRKSQLMDGHLPGSCAFLKHKNMRGANSYAVADFLIEHLYKIGALDSVLGLL